MRSRRSNTRSAVNAKSASRSARIGCICALVKRAARHFAATARQTGMQASTRMPADIRSSHPRNLASGGCTVIRMMRSRSIKLWRFVYRSRWLKRFHKCGSHRFAAGRIRPVCGPAGLAVAWRRRVAGPPRRCSFTLGRRPTGPWLQRLFTLNCEQRMPRFPLFSAYVCCLIKFLIAGAGIAPA